MQIKLKASITIGPEYSTHIGNMTIKDSEIVKFEKTKNSHIIEYFSDKIFPIKRSEFEIKFLDEFDDEFKLFNAFININGSLRIGVRLSYFEKIKLKWMLNKYLIQSKEIKIEILKHFIIVSFGFIGGIIFERNNSEKKIAVTTTKNEPKAAVNASLENRSPKKLIKRDTITVK